MGHKHHGAASRCHTTACNCSLPITRDLIERTNGLSIIKIWGSNARARDGHALLHRRPTAARVFASPNPSNPRAQVLHGNRATLGDFSTPWICKGSITLPEHLCARGTVPGPGTHSCRRVPAGLRAVRQSLTSTVPALSGSRSAITAQQRGSTARGANKGYESARANGQIHFRRPAPGLSEPG